MWHANKFSSFLFVFKIKYPAQLIITLTTESKNDKRILSQEERRGEDIEVQNGRCDFQHTRPITAVLDVLTGCQLSHERPRTI